ncbi:MAG: putative toxin-antitoxin system toxin component, PIN family [Bacteroidetes bacterium]|nr:putative toxin-antitoxin system toxin component, PIN family [Bacteroidota bacterium]
MRLTLDTNVLIAAFISRGTSHELFEHVVRHHELVLSPFIVGEFRRILRDKFGMPAGDVAEATALLHERAEIVAPEPLPELVCRDADDDEVLATARTGGCICLVTGDKDLLVLDAYDGIAIVSPRDFWAFEAHS